ncbi:hypothetical protein SCP_0802680 [Sparassis crispa]|uniref:Transcription regulator Rua1 C-terminal domain-containing protein n=1 Tax=Sparassis crispa TaxID=139825 RepID=A0A401GU65_9APHY|nr:hypothetical protein SCP_0802680 [Sparassis crispa]GBE85746.1 hypothetical protein SCP_0802680 [Sparassis crispa]
MPDEHNVPSTRHKRRAAEPAPQSKHKRPRFTSETDDESDSRSEPEGSVGPPSYPNRTFPQHIPMNKHFSLFYRRFPVSSYNSDGPTNGLSDAVFNPPTDPLSLYHPRFVKGKGRTKVGLCPCCSEDPTRGGGGTKVWLSLKFSAYNYHMQFNHGISASTGLPFSPPMEFRIVARAEVGKHEKARMTQGRCHRCKEWVPIEGIKDVPVKVKEIFWWKHAASCHQGSMISGEQDFYVEDDIYQSRLAERDAADGDGENSEDADVDGVHDANTGHDVDNTSNDSAA